MTRSAYGRVLPRAQILTERALATLDHFLHIEAVSGIALLLAAVAALLWANSPWAGSYEHIWHVPVFFGLGDLSISRPLHFWVNDALMTIFFLVVGMEIRREIHEGALSDLRQALLPIIAAIGGVAVPALIYLAFNHQGPQAHGWAVPTATDIAFAVGILALLGKSIPGNVRVFLLALAIIDDIIAVLIIAIFYSGGLEPLGFAVAGVGLSLVLLLQRMGIGTAYAYTLPGAIVWGGFLMTGAHPTLAGVVLGLMTPVAARRMREQPLHAVSRIAGDLVVEEAMKDAGQMTGPLKEMRRAQREVLPPVVRVQADLHPWVAFGIMPLFAFANAGVSLSGVNLAEPGPLWVTVGVAVALVLGKLAGIMVASVLAVKSGLCRLPPQVDWGGVCLIGLLAGVGFTMSIFIAMLAYADAGLIGAAKLGVLLGSGGAAVAGLAWGSIYTRRRAPKG